MKRMSDLNLHTDLFGYDDLISASNAFASICRIQITRVNHYYTCTFTDCIYDVKETIYEFENYVIDLMNTGGAVCL